MSRVALTEGSSSAAHTLSIGPLTMVFSYSTCVAFAVAGEGWFVSENVWSKTTGKHITQETPRGVERIPHSVFEKKLAEVLGRIEVHTVKEER